MAILPGEHEKAIYLHPYLDQVAAKLEEILLLFAETDYTCSNKWYITGSFFSFPSQLAFLRTI